MMSPSNPLSITASLNNEVKFVFEHLLKRRAREGVEMARQFAQRVINGKSGLPPDKELLNELRWADQLVIDLQLAKLCDEVVETAYDGAGTSDVEPTHVVMPLFGMVVTCKESLLRDEFSTSSSSPFQRAVAECQRAAYSRFVLEFQPYVDRMLRLSEGAEKERIAEDERLAAQAVSPSGAVFA